MSKGHGQSANNARSNSMNPNNAAHHAGVNNRSNQMNPSHPAHPGGGTPPPANGGDASTGGAKK